MADWIRPDSLVAQVKTIWDIARASAVRGVNLAHVCPSRLTELQIVASEQGGESRATYGEPVIRFLSPTLMREFGKGFSISALNCMRVFYMPYPPIYCQLATHCVTFL